MAEGSPDPYQTLGIKPSASDEQLRAAYRHLVQLHHPDHNGGSTESARRFEEVQEAYAQIRAQRSTGSGARATRPRQPPPRSRDAPSPPPPPPPRTRPDPHLEARLADLERELHDALRAKERALREAREAAAENARRRQRPSDEELGYITTADSFSKILTDAAAELSDRFSEIRHQPAAQRLSDLIDELGSKLTGEPPD
jgi:curved DNA-binding protein CbpA